MKRLSIVVMLVLSAALLAACTTTSTTGGETNTSANSDKKAAVVYFSKTGNTEKVSQMISDATGAEMVKIEPVNPYPDDYEETTQVAKDEQANNARPEIKTSVTDFSEYDIIYFGVPVWWGDLPMPAYTFLDKYDLSGKTVGVFTTHHGSGLGQCVESVEAQEPNANVIEGLAVYDTDIDESNAQITDWSHSVLETPTSH